MKANPAVVSFVPMSAPVMAAVAVSDVTGVVWEVAIGVVVIGVVVLLPQPESMSVPTMALAQRTGVRIFFRIKRIRLENVFAL